MRRGMYRRLFLSERSALFDLAVLGVVAALAGRRPWPLAAVVPYARRCAWRGQPWRRSIWRINAALVAGDAIALIALVRGSAAARRVLL